MHSDLLAWVASFFSGIWHFFTDIFYPGTSFSIAVVFLGFFIISFSIQLLKFVFGLISSGGGSISSIVRHISKERSHDEK